MNKKQLNDEDIIKLITLCNSYMSNIGWKNIGSEEYENINNISLKLFRMLKNDSKKKTHDHLL
jgi:hypothetical protein|tara:strand:+ start:593 stop:781 length:189 start_codon:yes stop_codon:yes gene_type:complete